MNGRQQNFGINYGALAFVLAMVGWGSTAMGQQTERYSSARPKVASEVQASYTEADPAPDYNLAPPRRPRNNGPRHFSYDRSGGYEPNEQRAPARAPRRGPIQRAAYQEEVQAEEMMPTPEGRTNDIQYSNQFDGNYNDGGNYSDDGYGDWDGPDGHSHGSSCNNCGSCNSCQRACPLCYGPWVWDNFSIFGGVQGFKGPVDNGLNGNFGFHEGINWGIPIWDVCGIGLQAGFQATQSDLSGTVASDDTRRQYFSTIGVFRRPMCGQGLQYGVVWDHLSDDFASRNFDLNQIRAEVSLVGCNGHEIGIWAAVSGSDDQSQRIERETIDMYNLFYRKRFCNGGMARIWAGFTGDSEGLLGAEASAPLTQKLSIAGAFNYRIPNESEQIQEARHEAWGLTMNLVWYPSSNSRGCCASNPYRPLFNVADNTTFMVK